MNSLTTITCTAERHNHLRCGWQKMILFKNNISLVIWAAETMQHMGLCCLLLVVMSNVALICFASGARYFDEINWASLLRRPGVESLCTVACINLFSKALYCLPYSISCIYIHIRDPSWYKFSSASCSLCWDLKWISLMPYPVIRLGLGHCENYLLCQLFCLEFLSL